MASNEEDAAHVVDDADRLVSSESTTVRMTEARPASPSLRRLQAIWLQL
jgi:hypothetical protein